MTGFGTADGSALGGRLRIEIRTVNHRYYNPQFRLPFELSGMEGPLRDRLRQLLDRGHVAVTARWLRSEEHTSELQSQSNVVCRLLLENKDVEIQTDQIFGQ